MTQERIKVESQDGAINYISLFTQKRVAHDADTPIILCMPAMGVRASYYQPLAEEFKNAGLIAATADLRGHGESDIRPSHFSDFGFYEMVHYDWPANVNALKERFPDNPLFLLGHSLGGKLSSVYLGVDHSKVAGLITVASCNIYYRGFPQPLKTLASVHLLSGFAQVLGFMPGNLIGFAGNEAKQMIKDWAYNARTGDYRFGKRDINYDQLIGNISIPVINISIEDDDLAPKEAVINLWQKFDSNIAEHWHLSNADFNHNPIDHFNWVRHAGPLIQRLTPWLSKRGR